MDIDRFFKLKSRKIGSNKSNKIKLSLGTFPNPGYMSLTNIKKTRRRISLSEFQISVQIIFYQKLKENLFIRIQRVVLG